MTGAGRVWRPENLLDHDGPLLLDTHIWIWYLEGDAARITGTLRTLLDDVARGAGLQVLDISARELGVKTTKGSLTLSVDAAVWLRRAERAPGIVFIPLDRDVLLVSTRLDAAHNDPADRMLIAAAQLNNVPLVTADHRIIDYARDHAGTPVVDARVPRR
jgi:PIN domain nuclease of toxin-antitoxin system